MYLICYHSVVVVIQLMYLVMMEEYLVPLVPLVVPMVSEPLLHWERGDEFETLAAPMFLLALVVLEAEGNAYCAFHSALSPQQCRASPEFRPFQVIVAVAVVVAVVVAPVAVVVAVVVAPVAVVVAVVVAPVAVVVVVVVAPVAVVTLAVMVVAAVVVAAVMFVDAAVVVT